MDTYSQVLSLLGLEEVPDAAKSQIQTVISLVESRLEGILTSLMGEKVTTVPDELSGIVTEISVNRYNRIGSEVASSHTVEGETTAWFSNDYFAPYMDEISRYAASHGASAGVKFL